jgi:predicted TIM-barrel fold metal-dependent hydrolase
MRIDIWTHLLSPAYVRHLERQGGGGRSAFFLGERALHDVEFRLRLADDQRDYRQILTPLPGLLAFDARTMASPLFAETVRRNNDELAEIARRHGDHFAGFVGATPITDPDAATAEAIRCVRELGALGVQLEADAMGVPLHEDRYQPLFATLENLDAAIWLHPCRTPERPGFAPDTTPFMLWQILGWPFDTTIAISKLIFSGIYDRHPALKLIAHHGGGVIPHLSGRIEMMPLLAGLDPGGSLTEALGRLERKPIDYFRLLYVDTAMFGAQHSVKCVTDFFGSDHVLFGSDAPFDAQAGSYFIPRTTADVEGAIETAAEREAIFHLNAQRVLGLASASRRIPQQAA